MSAATLRERLRVAPEVADTLHTGGPIVALESSLISHGLPYPQRVEVVHEAEAAVRAAGAVPATIAVRDGRILVGLSDVELETLAVATDARKASRPSLAAALAAGGWAGTTVSATMIAAHAAGIVVFATGGIGGVHRGALGPLRPEGLQVAAVQEAVGSRGSTAAEPTGAAEPAEAANPTGPTFDISSDLEELARTPVAVVCAGPKAILDVAATVEYLETRGVPVVAIGTDEVPGFYARGSGVPAPMSVPDVPTAAALARTHLQLGLGSAVLLCVPLDEATALPDEVVRRAVDRAVAAAGGAGVTGADLTPWLLARVAEETGGASLKANMALVVRDAAVGARLAVELATPQQGVAGS